MKRENKLTNVAFGIYFFIAVCFVAIRILSAFGLLSFLNGWTSYVFTLVIQVVLLFGGSVFLFSKLMKKKVKNTLEFYNFKKISVSTIIIAALVGVVVFFLNVFISSFFNSIISAFGYRSNSVVGTEMTSYPFWLLIVNIIFTAVLPAICEETAHRGMILGVSSKYGFLKSILISSILFGLLHLNIEQFFYATIIGFFLGYIALVSGSIYTAMIIHFMNNALSVFLTFSKVRGLGFGSVFTKISLMFDKSFLLGMIFVVCFFILLVLILKWLTKLLIISSFRDMAIESRKSFEKFLKRQNFFAEEEIMSPNMIQISDERLLQMFKKHKFSKMDVVTKVFFGLTFSMTLVLTIFTFVWGVL